MHSFLMDYTIVILENIRELLYLQYLM